MSYRPKGRRITAEKSAKTTPLLPLWTALVAAVLAAGATLLSAQIASKSQQAVALMSAEIEARKVERTAVDLVNRTTLDLLTRAVAHAKAHAISAALDKPFSRERPDPVDVFLDHTLLYLPDYYVDAHEFAKTAAELNATALECQVEFVKVDRLEGERRSSKEISAQSRKHESCFDGVVRVLEILDDQHSAIRNKMWEAIGAFNRSKTPPVVPNGPTERLR